MSKKILKMIIIIMIIIIIIITLILFRIKNNNLTLGEADETESDVITNDIILENSRNSYYLIKTIIENYYTNLSLFNVDNDEMRYFNLGRYSTEKELNEERLMYKNKVYNYLGEEYIESNKINIDNIQLKLGTFYETVVFTEDIYYKDITQTVREYFVNGYVIEKTTLQKTPFSMRVITDAKNSTFEIYPDGYGYVEGNNKIIEIEKNEIEDKGDNKYNFRAINDELHIRELFRRNINRFKYDIEGAYERLNNEYKEKKFKSLEDFNNYMTNNYDITNNIQINSYQKTNKEGYTQYVCIDKSGKYYIFRENNIMQYELILDTYTIDIPEFTERYNSVTNQEKVILNINKFMQSINDGDYRYAYSTLADSFKQNNFSTLEEFTNYVKANFFEKNEFDYRKFSGEADTYYTYEVDITDGNNTSEDVKTKTFIVLLEDGTDFKISFNV